ncbi:N-acetyltransferase family protein [Kitasatospora sp. HPMI-4]|uniref:GNAT family N-acetyltransferase n=1 Tax=Kitasatospora sp. HPMI-4 TaxID=3448443 RepID=UPI003F1CB9AC
MGDIRQARESDHGALVECVRSWWGESRTPQQARELSSLLPKLFLQHFACTSLVQEGPDGIEGFLVGFHSQDHPDQAYIHFVGVHPEHRGRGVARELYTRFCAGVLAAGRHQVRAITSPANLGSIAFHRAMGFTPDPGDGEVGGVPVQLDQDGQARVALRLVLERGRGGAPLG